MSGYIIHDSEGVIWGSGYTVRACAQDGARWAIHGVTESMEAEGLSVEAMRKKFRRKMRDAVGCASTIDGVRYTMIPATTSLVRHTRTHGACAWALDTRGAYLTDGPDAGWE